MELYGEVKDIQDICNNPRWDYSVVNFDCIHN